MNLRVPALILLLSAAGAHAQVPPPEAPAMSAEEVAQMQAAQQATQAWHVRAAEALAASGKARELALAATLLQLATLDPAPDADIESDAPSQPTPRDPRVDQWRRLASARAGSDVLANALLMQADSRVPGDAQIRAEAVERWRKLEPGNAAPLLYGSAGIDLALADARLMDRYDQHWYEQARWIQSMFLAHPPSAAELGAMTAAGDGLLPEEITATVGVGIMIAVASPNLLALTESCRGEALASTPTRRDDCRHLGRVMADTSDTNLGTRFGIVLLVQTADTARERALAEARRRRSEWQLQQWARVSVAQPRHGAEHFVRMLRDPAIRREQDAMRQALEEAGVPLDPPAGWQSPWR